MIHHGATRTVILLGGLAIKLPRPFSGWRPFLNGLLANMQEREFSATKWPELCPVLFSLPGGWLIVMRRAIPLSRDEWLSFDADTFCRGAGYTVPAEAKRDSFGWLSGHIVAVDYGT